ncbi:monosaccharide ABC transporter membrane protein (CUT2 family) [Motilibacter rhizosphaerae]|uniref:Monosaccharide ABC transporter membrane protein (CUT2 family) n=1 Tax=Motilibacter rhizosphaerae TaxID=598652 RepID=A0A4Q7NWZ9_9ACTN|nr:ABC transporter permease [Motilibacter rhizosphaerae]RZS91727.1 monosaccharide ABC transporter membrane protein (CUT2 family) [Motilibacter rhizosphaerae]
MSATPSSPAGLSRLRVDHLRRYGLWVVFAAVTLALAAASSTFRQPINLQNILEQNSILGIVACGMAVMMISGGFDLSVGAVGVSASVLAAVVSSRWGAGAAIVSGVLLGAAIGLVNGLLIARVRINAFVATFAMASIVSGLLFVATGAESKPAEVHVLASAASDRVAGVPVVFLVFLLCLALVWYFMTRTRYGHYVYSVGGNEEASHLSGVPVQAVRILAFSLGGLFASVAGLLLLGQTSVGQPSAASSWPLQAIAICVVGGIALTGGTGRIPDVLAATLFLGVIANGLNQLNVSPYWQPTVTGVVILVAVVLEQYNKQLRGSVRRTAAPRTASAAGAPHRSTSTPVPTTSLPTTSQELR